MPLPLCMTPAPCCRSSFPCLLHLHRFQTGQDKLVFFLRGHVRTRPLTLTGDPSLDVRHAARRDAGSSSISSSSSMSSISSSPSTSGPGSVELGETVGRWHSSLARSPVRYIPYYTVMGPGLAVLRIGFSSFHIGLLLGNLALLLADDATPLEEEIGHGLEQVTRPTVHRCTERRANKEAFLRGFACQGCTPRIFNLELVSLELELLALILPWHLDILPVPDPPFHLASRPSGTGGASE